MHIYMTAPEGDSLSPQQLVEFIEKARIRIDHWGVESETPFRIEIVLDNERSVLRASGGDGSLTSVSIENPQGSAFEQLLPVFEKRGWDIDGE